MLGLGRSLLSLFRVGTSPITSSFSPLRSTATPVINTNSIFSSFIAKRFKHEYEPRFKRVRKAFKGRVTVRTGGSIKGNKLEFGQFGLRLKSNGIRISAAQLEAAAKTIKAETKSQKGKVITRFVCDLAVCVKGNQTRMGKGKGAFDHWAVRVPTGKVLFELGNNVHERIAREGLRKAAQKLPGLYEIIDEKSKIRVSIDELIDQPKPVDYLTETNKNPPKKWLNRQAAKLPEYMMFRGR
ncbi:ribosomal protein L16 [Hyphopichia burtonii NRRL Y-1933]|uniref:Ribosomal protein L16 n=1 Tax=Hyphopichia burtonii NRRL Y-1933 TaxID=984485 RepID=A0A1E4RJP2_9ASCO|nr:ribosomal protein L16 [Hyphopichia burtonii NRRL Y-1933]ODV67494.1 ribosomal protein L16 [Hyphopichia burtonii NRRL Y-1933]